MVEYRVLSSAMMKDVPTLQFVWDQLMKAISAYNYSNRLPPEELVVSAINNSDVELAKKLINDFKLV